MAPTRLARKIGMRALSSALASSAVANTPHSASAWAAQPPPPTSPVSATTGAEHASPPLRAGGRRTS